MAAEAVIIELIGKIPGCPIRYTIASSAITKGSLLEFTDAGNRLVRIHTGIDKPIAGIAAEDTTVASGVLQITAYTNGIFDMTAAAAGATDVGHLVAGSATVNKFTAADGNDLLQGSFIGQAYEAVDNDEVAAIRMILPRII